jgi:hypothetical protein
MRLCAHKSAFDAELQRLPGNSRKLTSIELFPRLISNSARRAGAFTIDTPFDR